MISSPFHFGKTVEGDTFTDRIEDIKRLRSNFTGGINTILFAPRKWGKSSLVKKAAAELSMSEGHYKFCFLDLMRLTTESEFYDSFAREVLKTTASKPEEIWGLVKSFLSKVTPKISFGTDPLNDLEINFEINKTDKDYEEILNLPEKIAREKKIKLIICIDEFQELTNFEKPLLFQKRLRSTFQHHNLTTYCFYGSKKDMLANLFENKSMPFYKFGDIFFLKKISKEALVKFISASFLKTNKSIHIDYASQIVELMESHPYYVQQLSHLVWINTENSVTESIFKKALEELLNQNTFFFERETENLSVMQIKFLKMITDGIREGYTKAETIQKYGLGSSSNVIRVKKYLIQKQILDADKSVLFFLDPAFKLWFTKYFKS